jgi:hypothetical protein
VSTAGVRIYRHLTVEPDHSAAVLAGVAGRPLLLEQAHGKGTVVLCTTAADTDWSNLPMRASFFVPMVHQLVYHAARSARGAAARPVGARLSVAPEQGTVLHWYAPPEPPETEPRRVTPEPEPNVLPAARRPGVYRAVLGGEPGASDRLFVVNLDPRESATRRVEHPVARRRLGPERTTVVADVDMLPDLARRRRSGLPLWNYLLALALAVAVVETWLANVVLKT